jgi:hypothetical protein
MTAGNEEYKIEQKLLNNALQISIVDNRNNEYTGLFSKEFLSEKEDFLKYLSIKAIFEFFQDNINSKNYEIKIEDLIKLNLIIEYSPGKKIELLIPRKNLDENIQLNLITELTNIKKENKEIKEKLTYLEQKINILLQEKDKKDDLKGFENTIIKNNSEAVKILKWICPNNERRVKLLYKATPEENTRDDFHRKCDNKGATVTIIETTKGRRFGGYTSLSWDSSSEWKNDKEAFLFSLDNDKKYDVLQDASYKVYSNAGFGQWFGNNGNIGLAYEKNYFIGNDTHQENFGDKCYSTTVENELSGGKTFNISKMEVYQVINE